jgi:hypothetical protein
MTLSEERTLGATANISPPPVYDRSTPEVGVAVSSARPVTAAIKTPDIVGRRHHGAPTSPG